MKREMTFANPALQRLYARACAVKTDAAIFEAMERAWVHGYTEPATGLRFGARYCGPGHRVFIAFEIGPTVDSLETALALTHVAGNAEASAIKVQILEPARLIGEDSTVAYTQADGTAVTESMRAILDRRWLTPDEWRTVKQEADRQGLAFLATVDTPASLALAVELGSHGLKVCSGDVTMLDWIRTVARMGKPVLLDTGHATLGEIEQAVDAALEGGAAGVCLHHCPGGYPSRLEGVNLRILTTLRQLFGDTITLGFSDHNPGRDFDLAAVALGVDMIEKTLTRDRTAPGPEHMMSVEPHEARGFVQAIRDLEVALGFPRRRFTPEERAKKSGARRSAFLAHACPAGHVLTAADLDWRRPGTGIEPHEAPYLIGRTLARELPAGQLLRREDLA